MVLWKNLIAWLLLNSFQVFERSIYEECKPRCVCQENNGGLISAHCCGCDPCRDINCQDACINGNEQASECCNCPTPPPPPPSCFPAESTVKLATGKTVAMYELQIGDKVQTGMDTEIVTSKFYISLYPTFTIDFNLLIRVRGYTI